MTETDMKTLFQQAVDGYGKAYLDTESAIIAQGETATKFLAGKLSDSSLPPFTVFIATTLADSIENTGEVLKTANMAITEKVDRAARSPLGNPRPDAIAGVWAAFGDKLTNIVALHLVKNLQWPHWKSLAAIIYLGYYADASVLPALDQFKADIKGGKRGPVETEPYTSPAAALDQAMDNVRITIEADAKKDKGST